MRAFEIAIVLLLIPILILPFLVVSAIVFSQIGRPIFFDQTRMGKNEKPFVLMKFRTMTDDRDGGGALLPDRERQTRATKLLRRLRLDEMPQLLNIFLGQMALVGPRPLLPETILRNGQKGALRCRVRPGLTGWAQISGNTLLSEEEKLALDLWYVENRSVSMDLRIILETIKVLIVGERRNAHRLAQATAVPDSVRAHGA